MIKKILVGLGELKSSEAAIRTAVSLAESHGAAITGIAVFDLAELCAVGPEPIGSGRAAMDLQDYRLTQAQARVKEVEEALQAACEPTDIPLELVSAEGDPFQVVASWARVHDLTVLASRHLFEHGVVEEPSDGFLRLIQLGVQPIVGFKGEFREIRHALIAYSGSQESARAMRAFVQLRPWPGIRVRIVNFGGESELLEKAADYCRAHGLEAEIDQLTGSPVTGVLDQARAVDADLIVAGSSSKSLLRQRLFGETALHLARHSDRPLFLC